MFFKLLKHDLRYIYKVLATYYLIALGCAILGRLLVDCIPEPPALVQFIGTFLKFASLSLSLGLIINALSQTWARFQKSLYGDEAYLTHTLPVSRRTLFLVKFTSSFVTVFLNLAVVVLVVLIACESNTIETMLSGSIYFITGSSLPTSAFVIILSVVFLLEVLFIVQCGFFGILAGHKLNQRRKFFSILFGLAFYSISTLVTLGILILFSLSNSEFSDLLSSGLLTRDNFLQAITLSASLYLMYIIISVFINTKVLKAGVDIE